MIRRYLPWLFLAAAVFSLVGVLMEKHTNGWFVASRITMCSSLWLT